VDTDRVARVRPREELITVRSGTNWVFLRGQLEGIDVHTTTLGRPVAEVRISLPLGRGREERRMILPALTWNVAYARRLAAVPPGTMIDVVGHVAGRRWATPGGAERLGSEIQLDSCSLDLGDWWRLPDPPAPGHRAPREGD